MARDDYRFSGPLRRVVVIRQKPVQEDVQEVVQEDVQQPVQENVGGIERDEEYIASLMAMDEAPEEKPFGGKKLSAEAPAGAPKELKQLRGGFVLKIDDVAGNWIRAVRDAGGGITMGPKDGIIAVPAGGPRVKGFVGDLMKPQEEPEPEQAMYPKDLEEMKEMGRQALEQPAEEEQEFEQAVQKSLGAIRRLMAQVERTIRRR